VTTVVGVTGHQVIPTGARGFVVNAVQDLLRELESPLRAFTSLAAGADQLVAKELLSAGGRLHVIVPSRDYEQTFAVREDLACFRTLLTAADAVSELDYQEASEEAFLAAGRSVVDNCEMLIAVWDGKPARGLGGTADVVRYARDSGKPVSIVWPDDLSR
jgi:hypothetical protein